MPIPEGERHPWGYTAVIAGVIGGIFAGQIGLLIAAGIHGSAITSATGPLWGLALSSLCLQLATGGVPLAVAGPKALGVSIRWIDLPVGIATGVFAQLVLVWLLYKPLSHWISSDDLEGRHGRSVISCTTRLIGSCWR